MGVEVPAVDAFLSRFMDVLIATLPTEPDMSLEATRLACTVLAAFGYAPAPVPVQVHVYNPALVARCAQAGRLPADAGEAAAWLQATPGGAIRTLGARPPGEAMRAGAGKGAVVAGHLVTWLPPVGLVLDPLLPLTNAPAAGITLPALVTSVPAEWATGGPGIVLRLHECLVVYQAVPRQTGWERTPIWRHPERQAKLLAAIQRQISARL